MKNALIGLLMIGSSLMFSCGEKNSAPSENNNNVESTDISSEDTSSTTSTDTTASSSGEDNTDYGNGSTRTSGNSGH